MSQIRINLQTPASKSKPVPQEEKPKKKKWPDYARTYCEREDTLCFYIDMETGKCMADRCNIHDPEYIAEQKRIQENMQHNHLKDIGEYPEDRSRIADSHRKEHIARQEYINRGVPMPEELRKKINKMQQKER